MEKKVSFQVVVGALVQFESKLLIVRRSAHEKFLSGYYELPGGKKEPLEDIHTCVLREVYEETGLNVKLEKVFSVFNYTQEKPEIIKDSTQINFFVTAESPAVILSEEHDDFRWISADEVKLYPMSPETTKTLTSAFEFLAKK